MDTTMQERTTEEIRQLKDNWLKDPCWNIEDTPGFEAHINELQSFRILHESQWKTQREEREGRRKIQTIVTRIYANGAVSTHEEDDAISILVLKGWTVVNVSMVHFTDNGGDWPVVVIERVVTLIRTKRLIPAPSFLDEQGNS